MPTILRVQHTTATLPSYISSTSAKYLSYKLRPNYCRQWHSNMVTIDSLQNCTNALSNVTIADSLWCTV